jgi:hypothetical protein
MNPVIARSVLEKRRLRFNYTRNDSAMKLIFCQL